MRILVTGGAGFIGSNLADRLVQEGHDVGIVDDFSSGREENVGPSVRVHRLDVRDASLRDVFREERPQVVYHLAAHIDVRRSVADPTYDAGVNILGTLNLLECCRAWHVSRVIYAGTAGALFGEPSYLPVDEAHPIDPISPYGVSKHTVEHYLFAYRATHGLDYVVLRYPNVYGPRQNPRGEAGVVAIFATQMLTGQRPTIFGDGTKTRDYCYVGDIVEANVIALTSPGGRVYNLGRGIEISDLEIFEAVRDAVGVQVTPAYSDTRPGEIDRIALDASRARDELGWRWTIDIKEGVGRAVEYYRDHVAAREEGA